VALVGRPNVGKSTLFNRLTQRRAAITEATPGVTRDRLYAPVEWQGHRFTLVDTGGILSHPRDALEAAVRRQAEAAVQEADVVLLVVDARQGLTPEDHEVAAFLRRSGRPVLLVANKVDAPSVAAGLGELYALGLGDPLPVSAEHGRGTGDLLDQVVQALRKMPPSGPPEESEDEDTLRVAVVGRPNVGKSSLVNALLGQERQIVSTVPGTTRDAVDIRLRLEGEDLVLVDTAGLRRPSRVARGSLEGLSVLRSLRAVQRAHVALLVLDGQEGVASEDQRIAGYVLDQRRALVVAVNKWDLVRSREEPGLAQAAMEDVRRRLSFVEFAPVRLISALTGWHLTALVRDVLAAGQAFHRHLATSALNEVVSQAQLASPPPSVGGRSLKVYYATQVRTGPPTVALFCNDPALATPSYLRYLEGQLRRAFPLEGTPVRLVPRPRRPAA
jgi:GTP-binding protein